ncbi:MAG TPA: helix-turn-helix domain-containing protein, partial [Anaerolineaceae bacterium]|nr:helix-turn-helix domain-containing protein [Anaerolineaceae bacterium]
MTDPNPSTTERTLRLVELLLSEPDGYSPQALMRQLGISRSSLFQLLRTLKTLGYVEQPGQRGRYRPGPRLHAWLDRLRSLSPAPLAQDLLTAFYQEAGRRAWPETVLLTARSNATEPAWRVLGQVEGQEQVRSVYDLLGSEGQGKSPNRAEPGAAAQVLTLPPPAAVRQNGYSLV